MKRIFVLFVACLLSVSAAFASRGSSDYSVTVTAVVHQGTSGARVTVTSSPADSVITHLQLKVFSAAGGLLSVLNTDGNGTGVVVVDGVAATAGQSVQAKANVIDRSIAARVRPCTASAVVIAPPENATITILQGDLLYPIGLAANSTSLFWTERWDSPWGQDETSQGRIWMSGLDGSNPHVIATGQSSPVGIAADDTVVYWANFGNGLNDGSIVKYDLATAQMTTVVTGEPGLGTAVTLVNGTLFWSGSGIWSLAANGTRVLLSIESAVNMASDGISLFWTEYAMGPGNAGRVMKMPLGGGPATALASDQPQAWDVHTDGTSVVWSDQAWQQPFPSTINRMPIGGGPAQTLASGNEIMKNFAIDSDWAYFVDSGVLYVVPLAGGPVSVLAASVAPGGAPEGNMVVSGHNVYWTDTQSQAVMRASW